MKGGFCVIYKSLLTLSVISSCALFLLVVSEALQGDANSVDLSGLHNVSQKSKVEDAPDPPSAESQTPAPKPEPDNIEMMFAETLSLNSVTTDGIPDTGQPPILISLSENAKLELKPPGELLYGNESEHNDTQSFILVDGELPPSPDPAAPSDAPEPHLVVRARPMHETKPEEPTTPPPEPEESQNETEPETENIPKPETPQEDIPSFSEWAQKQLAEAEKKDTVLNHSSQPSHSNTNFSSKNTKLRSKNYASLACGAKVVAVNPEAGSASSILSPNRDEYMLNTCNSRIWFVVELCEAVQAQKIEIANFELFSSTPKDILVYFSDRFPTREWTSVGQFTAKDMRDVQSFDLFPHLFGKFIKVEMLSHHGSEHYCPVSLFKVYGTSEFEVLEKESAQHAAADEDEDEVEPAAPAAAPARNLFGSARDAVMSIMKKAAQALVKTELPKNTSEQNDTSVDAMYKRCCSPSHIIVCDNCSETLYNEVYELISCSSDRLTSLVRQVFMRETLKCTGICAPFGLDFKSTKTIEFSEERVAYMNALFPTKYLAALCNILAIKEKKVVLNTSFETDQNTTVNETVEESPQRLNGETTSDQEVKLVPDTGNSSDDKTNETELPESKPAPPEQPVITNVPVELPKEEEKSEATEEPPRIEEKPLEPQEELKPPEPEKAETKVEDVIKVDVKNGKEGEKMKETGSGAEEVDPMLMDSDSFMSELDQMAVDPTPAGAQAQTSNQPNTIQKESVFLRLSNRVKTLERNMSLSGQYLEELSRRYKKQVEEMQKTFEKTVQQMTEERRRSAEREQKYLEQMADLQEKLSLTTASLTTLMDDRDSWFGNITFFKFIFYQSIIIAAAVYYVTKTRKPEKVLIPVPRRKKKQDRVRRKSVEGVSGHETPSAKKRRPSEEALQITRHCIEVLDDDGEWQIARKNRRRKTSIVHRMEETKANWRPDNIQTLQENPIPLDEEEFFAPVSEPAEFEEPKKELPKVNGSFFNNLKSKTMKTRRLSSPAFLRTFSRQSSRSNPPPPQNGKASDSPTGSLWSASTDLSRNGHDSKRKKSLKNIFKKVF